MSTTRTKPLRILMVTNYFIPTYQGGAEVALYNTARGLQAAGHEVRILSITTRVVVAKDAEYQVDGLPVHEIHLPRMLRNPYLEALHPAVASRVWSELSSYKPDVVHTHNLSGASLAPFWVTARRGVPTVATTHDQWLLCANNMMLRKDGRPCGPELCDYRQCLSQYDFWAPIGRRRQIFRRLSKHVHTFISPSRRIMQLHVERGYDPARFTVLRHGLYPLVRPPTESISPFARYKQGANTMVFVGAIAFSKGIDVLLRAVPHLIAEIPDFRLLIAGQGPPHYQAQLSAFGDHVVLLGLVPRQQIAEVYAGAGLTVLPSVYEDNSPISICESLMSGTPVLASRIGGIPELIEENRTGYLSAPGNEIDFVEKAVAHFKRPAYERRAMRRACVEYAAREFCVDRHINRLLEIYGSAIHASGGR